MKTKQPLAILDFIRLKLAAKCIEMKVNKIINENNYIRIFCDNNMIFTLIPNTSESLNQWYAAYCFDDSMDEADKDRIRIESPLNKIIDEYFPQQFYIDGKWYYLRMS